MKEKQIEIYNGKVWGFKVSEYGLEHKRLDYRTLAEMVGDMIICNSITELMYGASINGEHIWADIENGSEYEEIDEETTDETYEEQYKEFYQYYIISERGAEILKRYTDETVWYIPRLDMYIWGIDHCGTSWDYVLTDIEIIEKGE